MINKIESKAAKIFNTKKENIKVIKRLLGGMSNYTYKIEYLGKYYTFRFQGEDVSLFVDHKDEHKHLKKLKGLNLTPKLIYFNEQTGTKISSYLKGIDLSKSDDKKLSEVAKTIKKLHSLDCQDVSDYSLIERLTKYESYNKNIDKRYFKIKKRWIEIYDVKYIKNEKVFCHNDLQETNILLDENNEIFLLDFEYSGLNDPFYDIASFGTNSKELLKYYLKTTPTEEQLELIDFYQIFQYIQWYLVALFKYNQNLSKNLNTDFKLLTEIYLNEAEKLIKNIKEW